MNDGCWSHSPVLRAMLTRAAALYACVLALELQLRIQLSKMVRRISLQTQLEYVPWYVHDGVSFPAHMKSASRMGAIRGFPRRRPLLP